jgi:hypothetical protein
MFVKLLISKRKNKQYYPNDGLWTLNPLATLARTPSRILHPPARSVDSHRRLLRGW